MSNLNISSKWRHATWLPVIFLAMTSCYTVHKDVGVVYANAYPQAKEKFEINKGARGGKIFDDKQKPVVVVRADAAQTTVSETEMTDRYVEYLWIESTLIEKGYTVKDRVLVDNVAGSSKKRDYSEIRARTGVDVIVDVGSANMKNFETPSYFNQRLNQQRELNSAAYNTTGPYTHQTISIPMYNVYGKVTDVKTGHFIGDFNIVTNAIAAKNLEKVNMEVLTRDKRGIIDYDMKNTTTIRKTKRAVYIFPCYVPFGLIIDFFIAGSGGGVVMADMMFGAWRAKGTDHLHGDKPQFLIESSQREAMEYSVNKLLTEF